MEEHLRSRRSLQSYSSVSEQYNSSIHDKAWLGRTSMDSLMTTSTTSGISYQHGNNNKKKRRESERER